MTADKPRLVLASSSATRRALLASAGVDFEVRAADVDEAAIRDRLLAAVPAVSHEEIALTLAGQKALAVSMQDPGALVIGADQVLSFEGVVFEKPKSIAEARDGLRALRGKTHALHSATALAANGVVLWKDVETAHLTMRAFSEAALDSYLARAGGVVLTSVGAYQIEGPAVQLFENVEGDHSTILGLPLLPVLHELRRRGMLAT